MALELRAPSAPSVAAGSKGEAGASFLSRVCYTWINPLFTKANSGAALEEADLLPLTAQDSPAVVSARFEALLKKHTELKAANPVTSALWEQFSAPMVAAGWRAWAAQSPRAKLVAPRPHPPSHPVPSPPHYHPPPHTPQSS